MAKRSRRFRNWLVWWLQQKRKERNATTSFPSYILSALSYLVGDSSEGEVVDSIGTTTPPTDWDYKAQSFLFDGSTHVALPSIEFQGAVTLEMSFISTGSLDNTDILTLYDETEGNVGINVKSRSNGDVWIRTGSSVDSPYTVSLVGVVSLDSNVNLVVDIDASGNVSAVVNGNTVTPSVISGSPQAIDYSGALVIGALFGESYSFKYTGHVYGIKLTDSSGNLVLYCPGTDAVGTSIPMQINGLPAYGTLTGATLPDFYATHQDGVSGFDPGVLGFSIADTHGTLTDGCVIPADPSLPSLDITGNNLQYPGPIKKNAEYTGYAGTWDGTAYLANANLVGTETVTASDGTSTPSVSAGKIDFTVGYCSDLTLSNGDRIIVSSSSTSEQTNFYSVTSSEVYVLTTATTPFCTTESQEATYLMESGWELNTGSYIPAKAAGGESATGQPLTASPGDLRSFEPGFIEMPQSKDLLNADIVGQYGVELVENGTFDTDYSGWALNASATASVSNGQVSVTRVSGANDTLYQAITTVVDKTYSVDFDSISGNTRVRVSSSNNFLLGFASLDAPGTFVAEQAETFIGLCSSTTGTAVFDNVVVQELQDPINYFFEPGGDQREIEYADLSASPFVGGTVNDQYFFSVTKGLAIYDEPQDADDVIQIEDYMGIT